MSAWSDAVLALSPSSFWRFSGGALTDSGSGAATLTATGSPTVAASLVPGEAGAASEAYTLNGTSQYFQAGNVYPLSGEINWTLGLWVQSSDYSGFRRLLEKRNTGAPTRGWLVYTHTGGSVTMDIDMSTGAEGYTEGGVLATSAAYWLVLTWVDSSASLSIYRNGSLIGTDNTWTNAPGFPAATTGSFTIGASSSGSTPTGGVIDDVTVWSGTALNSTQITTLWTAAQAAEKQSFYISRRRTTRR